MAQLATCWHRAVLVCCCVCVCVLVCVIRIGKYAVYLSIESVRIEKARVLFCDTANKLIGCNIVAMRQLW